ncbi:hypothetical protein GDO81_018894 [Engystomops pustulosus]|uniref:Uncharacterized protein n=1 Tax=Engystomops pustulosus TaxID=76066 RepID=A0AAV6Z2M0_ENGPU|nr:hypothetical protein GDO81_018894 [Engystomops pustulosus]
MPTTEDIFPMEEFVAHKDFQACEPHVAYRTCKRLFLGVHYELLSTAGSILGSMQFNVRQKSAFGGVEFAALFTMIRLLFHLCLGNGALLTGAR